LHRKTPPNATRSTPKQYKTKMTLIFPHGQTLMVEPRLPRKTKKKRKVNKNSNNSRYAVGYRDHPVSRP
jgi:hypothetical protein